MKSASAANHAGGAHQKVNFSFALKAGSLTAAGIDHTFSATGHDVDPIVNTPAMSSEFMIVAPTPNDADYPVALALEDLPGFIATYPIARRNKQVEVGMWVAIAVISQSICVALSCGDGSK